MNDVILQRGLKRIRHDIILNECPVVSMGAGNPRKGIEILSGPGNCHSGLPVPKDVIRGMVFKLYPPLLKFGLPICVLEDVILKRGLKLILFPPAS